MNTSPRQARIAAGLSLSDAAKAARYSEAYVAAYERNYERLAAMTAVQRRDYLRRRPSALPSEYTARRLSRAIPNFPIERWWLFDFHPQGARNAQ
jgi:hypothetical protein